MKITLSILLLGLFAFTPCFGDSSTKSIVREKRNFDNAAPEKPNFVFDDSQLGKPLQTNGVEVSLSNDGNSLVAGKALEENDPSGCDLRILYADASSRLVYKIQYVLEGNCTSTNFYASFSQ